MYIICSNKFFFKKNMIRIFIIKNIQIKKYTKKMTYFYCPKDQTVVKFLLSKIGLTDKFVFDGINENEVNRIKEKFDKIAKNGKLNKEQFSELYKLVKDEEPQRLEKIAEIMFTAFDYNKVKNNFKLKKTILNIIFNQDGLISFEEFIVFLEKINKIFIYNLSNLKRMDFLHPIHLIQIKSQTFYSKYMIEMTMALY